MTELEQQLQAENAELRSLIEEKKKQELEQLKAQLLTLSIERDHYRSEAERNARIGRQIAATAEGELNRLRATIINLQKLPSRETRSGRRSTAKP